MTNVVVSILMRTNNSTPLPKVVTAQAVKNKTVIVRVDLNVPLAKQGNNIVVADDRRLTASLETINFLKQHSAKIVLISHLGRPKNNQDKHLSLAPVAKYLTQKLNIDCQFCDQVLGSKTTQAVESLNPGEVLLLENLRFESAEKDNQPAFAQKIAKLGGIFINEAFANSHRSHASIVSLPKYLPSYAGFNLIKELESLKKLLQDPKRPFVTIVGGAKIKDKVAAIRHLAKISDIVLLGGVVANDFLKAEGLEIYRSLVEESGQTKGRDYIKLAHKLIDAHKTDKLLIDGYLPLPKILYPIDALAGPSLKTQDKKQLQVVDLTHDMKDKPENVELTFGDIGPKTISLYQKVLETAKTVFWNGPMGVWENPLFSTGTKSIAQAISQNSSIYSVLGGGDTISALDHFKLTPNISMISTGGGASLEVLSGRQLVGVKAILESKLT
jgi:phosphoglycerate kinase